MRTALTCAGLVVAFVVGIAVGEALQDGSAGSGTQSIVRTLQPVPLAPAAERTVTVTTTAP